MYRNARGNRSLINIKANTTGKGYCAASDTLFRNINVLCLCFEAVVGKSPNYQLYIGYRLHACHAERSVFDSLTKD